MIPVATFYEENIDSPEMAEQKNFPYKLVETKIGHNMRIKRECCETFEQKFVIVKYTML